MASDTFDAVLAEMDALAAKIASAGINGFGNHVTYLRDRLSAAHAAEVGERDARIAELEAEADRRTREVEMTYPVQQRLLARAEAAERDAGRYRWLRSLNGMCDADACVTFNIGFDWIEQHGDDLDTAIDAAIATTEQADED